MIDQYIERLVATYPAQIAALENAVDALMPFAILMLIFGFVWRAMLAFDRWLDRSEAKRLAQAREPHYRTADGEQIRRETESIWQPWHETMPPEIAAPKEPNRLRAGPAKVLDFPSPASTFQQPRRSRP